MTKSRDLRPVNERLTKKKEKASEIARLLNVPRRTVYNCLKRLEETGSINDRRRSGRPKTATSGKIIKKIRDKIRYNLKRSIRQIAKDEGISEGSVRPIVHKKLGKYPYKI